MASEIDEIHSFWFGELDGQGMSPQQHQGLWFKSTPETDAQCRDRFGHLIDSALQGGLMEWEASDTGVVALILLLDQFTRNTFRGTAKAFAGDPRALGLARRCIADGRYQRLPTIHRVFLLMPLEHSEEMATQEECVGLFEELIRDSGAQQITGFSQYAMAHRDVIAQFGRFPHRNAILGRQSTPAEIAHLETHGGF